MANFSGASGLAPTPFGFLLVGRERHEVKTFLNPHYARATYCDRRYGGFSGRPRVFLRHAQDKLTLRRIDNVRLRSSPALPRDGCPVVRPSPPTVGLPRGRGGLRRKAHVEPLPSFAQRTALRAFPFNPADRSGLTLHYQCRDYAALQSRLPCLGLATASRA
jgi:hypothetical protein